MNLNDIRNQALMKIRDTIFMPLKREGMVAKVDGINLAKRETPTKWGKESAVITISQYQGRQIADIRVQLLPKTCRDGYLLWSLSAYEMIACEKTTDNLNSLDTVRKYIDVIPVPDSDKIMLKYAQSPHMISESTSENTTSARFEMARYMHMVENLSEDIASRLIAIHFDLEARESLRRLR